VAREPRCTYRLQLHAEFDLDAAAALADYLAGLGVSHVYTSPLLQAVPGSAHGYDVVDPTRVDRERGGEAALERFRAALAEHGLGHLLDIVPNHMATAPPHDPWWWDVLRHGRRSRFASFFDIEWEPDAEDLQGRVLVPVLGRALEDAVHAGDIRVGRLEGECVVRYGDLPFPLSLDRVDPEDREAVEDCHDLSPDRLLRILGRQPYRLSHWRRGRGELNYRRFFDVSDLAGLRQEDPAVFDATHHRLLRWVSEGRVDGLRVDHPDGLRDPAGYLEQLRKAAPDAWVVVEKILEPGEALRPGWAVAGTTGYDFGAMAGGLFVDPRGEAPLGALYREVSGDDAGWEETARATRLRAMERVLPAEVARLEGLFAAYLEAETGVPAPPEAGEVLREVLAAFPVYRTYVRPGPTPGSPPEVAPEDEAAVDAAVAGARRARPDLGRCLFGRLADALLLRSPTGPELAVRFQQLSGPVMAKGVEDTAFYAWPRYVALHEVGDSPGRFGVSPAEFHAFCRQRAARWPETLDAVSTHDSKRSADVRAGLWLLSEIPEEWAAAVRRWRRTNRRHRTGALPDGAAEYLLYQTLVGAWPLTLDRARAYMQKAAREAKVHTTWTAPNAEYEGALEAFVEGVMGDADFRSDLAAFMAPLVEPRRRSSLALTVLHLTAPGVPDLYQGGELWDLTLVDPDNRRPVDFALRRRLLEELDALSPEAAPAAVLGRAGEGLPKLWVVRQALALRRRRPELFGAGSGYRELAASGAKAEHAVAFLRTARAGEEAGVALSLVPRRVLGLGGWNGRAWKDTRLPLPAGRWRNVLTGEGVEGGREAPVGALLARFPVAVLEREEAP